jgi:hypothetical protein
MANECTKCIHHPVCKTAESCDGFVSGCKHFKEGWTPKTIITLHGYNAEALVLIAEMLRKKMITEEELDNFLRDFTKMYEIIIREQKVIISEAMATFEFPTVGEAVEKLWEESNWC